VSVDSAGGIFRCLFARNAGNGQVAGSAEGDFGSEGWGFESSRARCWKAYPKRYPSLKARAVAKGRQGGRAYQPGDQVGWVSPEKPMT
jgi:hypothetical protein